VEGAADENARCLVADCYAYSEIQGGQTTRSKVLYDEQLLSRVYSITNQMNSCVPPLEKLISITQFANHEFSLTASTANSPTYKVDSTNSNSDQHAILKYQVVSNTVNESTVQNNIIDDQHVITKMNMLMDAVTAYGYLGDINNPVLFVKDSAIADPAKLIYAYGAERSSIKKNYIMENKLTPLLDASSELYGYHKEAAGSDPAVSLLYVKNIPVGASELAGTDVLAYRSSINNDNDNLKYNFTPAKNIYNNDWQLELDNSNALNTIREYTKIGNTNGALYLKYRVYMVEDPCVEANGEMSVPLYEYEMIERVKGLYKFKSNDGHKSNIFSIRIENSGLKTLLEDAENLELKKLLIDSVRKFTKKLIPANTQLWKVEFTGK
jgi:hypothetical protein